MVKCLRKAVKMSKFPPPRANSMITPSHTQPPQVRENFQRGSTRTASSELAVSPGGAPVAS